MVDIFVIEIFCMDAAASVYVFESRIITNGGTSIIKVNDASVAFGFETMEAITVEPTYMQISISINVIVCAMRVLLKHVASVIKKATKTFPHKKKNVSITP